MNYLVGGVPCGGTSMTAGLLFHAGVDMGAVNGDMESIVVSGYAQGHFEKDTVSRQTLIHTVESHFSVHDGLKYPDLCRCPDITCKIPGPKTIVWVNRDFAAVAACMKRKFKPPYFAMKTAVDILHFKDMVCAQFDRVYEIDYEDFIAYPRAAVTEFIAELGLPASRQERMLKWVVNRR